MDGLNSRWVPIEKNLYAQAFPQGVSLVLSDLTSVYFEGKGPQGLGAYGYSRDHREDRPQILLAVATDTQGVPSTWSAARKSGRYDHLARIAGKSEAALWHSAGDFCL
jgi:hypothetical protein